MTPSRALLGYELAKKGEWEIPSYVQQRHPPSQDAKKRRRVIRTRQLNFEEKEYPNQHENPPVTFRRGERVMVKENVPSGPFAPVWSGPHEIAVRWSPQIYEVDKNGRQFKYHVDQLRPAPAGNPSEPEDSDTEEEDPPNNDVSFSEDESRPVIVITKAQIHATPQDKEKGRPADTEVEQYVPSPSGTSLPSRNLTMEDGTGIRILPSSNDESSDRATRRYSDPMTERPLSLATNPPINGTTKERPGGETPSTPLQGSAETSPGIIVLRRPRRRKPSTFSLQPQGYIEIERECSE